MSIIHVLDQVLSNKIAAGEVVERPSSIVKELVENALDAGSTSIEIALEEAGLRSIQVIDNGSGMKTEDAKKAFERHATSKIIHEHDLFRIRTLGFRGEALPSIAAVAKVTLITSDGATSGTMIRVEGGQFVEETAAPFRKGTTIQVEQLFYNTPARLKHVRTIQTELGHTIGLVNRLALSHTHCAFRLTHGKQEILRTTGNGKLPQVLAAIYGLTVAKKMHAFAAENADYRIEGYCSLPEVTRASRNYLTFIVNGRAVQSPAINRAVLAAYHTYLPIGRYPIAVINVVCDPQLIDVNVHPSKQQVRISKEGTLLQLIEETIQRTIHETVIVPTVQPTIEKKKAQTTEQLGMWKQPNEPTHSPIYEESEITYMPSFPNEEVSQLVPEVPMQETDSNEENHKQFPQLFIAGQVHGTYIIAQNEDGFYLIDQHAAQERIKYEYFVQKLGTPSKDYQLLLLPLQFTYTKAEQVVVEERKAMLEAVGIRLEPFGPATYIVRECPTWFPPGEEIKIIEEMIEQCLEGEKITIRKVREEAAILMSCKRSIKANHHLTTEQMEHLVNELATCHNPFTCPHGRPVLIHFTTYEIEKMFKRIM